MALDQNSYQILKTTPLTKYNVRYNDIKNRIADEIKKEKGHNNLPPFFFQK